MTPEPVKLDIRPDGVATIVLNRPEARNALNLEMADALARAIEVCQRPQARAVLLTGSGGGAFCAGGDVKEFAARLDKGGPEELGRHLRVLADNLHRNVILPLRELPKPVVMAVNGVAAGAGFSLALAGDLRLAARSARFLMAYAAIGATPDAGATFLLPRIVGQGRAMELYLASQPASAEYAQQLGLVSQVFPDETLGKHALETALRLAQGPTLAYGRAKKLFNQSWDANLADQLNAESEAIGSLGLTQDFQAGIRAFAEKRLPWFQGG